MEKGCDRSQYLPDKSSEHAYLRMEKQTFKSLTTGNQTRFTAGKKIKVMMRHFIYSVIPVLILAAGCSIPEKVKKGSTDIVTAQQKFIEENNRFYDAVFATFSDNIEESKSRIRENIQTKIDEIPKIYLNGLLRERKLPETGAVTLSREDQLLLLNTTMEAQGKLLATRNSKIDTLEARKKKVELAINVLKKYQGEIFNTMKSLDTYIQIQKFHEALWEDTKNLIGGKNDKIDDLIKKIDSLKN